MQRAARNNRVTVELDYADDPSEDYAGKDVQSFVGDAQAKGLEARLVAEEGPGAGWPVVRLAGGEDAVRTFLTEAYDPELDDEAFEALLVLDDVP